MMFDEKNLKMWSRIGSRAAFGMAALELGALYDDLMVLTADVSTSAGLERFKRTYPEKYLDVGIAEQNMLGIAAGLSSEGMKVVTTTFAPFQTMRCCEQIRVNLGYMHQKVCMVGLASGVVLGNLGYTHCCIEDISIMRAIPNITVLSPADCGETVKAVLAAMNHHESVYIRLTGGVNNPMVHAHDYEFAIGKAVELRKGNDVAIVATGTMVHHVLETANVLSLRGIEVAVIDLHTIKPLDEAVISRACEEAKLIVTVEEHNICGGLGSAVAEYKATLRNAPPQLFLGLPDTYGKAGDYDRLMMQSGLTPNQMADRIERHFEAVRRS